MHTDALHTALPDFSARIIRNAVINDLSVSWESFCRRSHVQPIPLDEGATELFAQDELRLQQGFVQLTAEQPDLWVDLGLRYRALQYGALGLAMMTARTLGEALEVAGHYQALTYSFARYRFQCVSNGACAVIGNHKAVPADLAVFSQHRDLGAVRTLINDLTGGEPVLEKMTVAADPPPNWRDVRRHFSFPVEFNAERMSWIFLPGCLDKPLPLADADLFMHYSAHCAARLHRAQAASSVVQRLALLLGSRGGESLSVGEAAQRLALSERTLHRRLAAEGKSFSTMVVEARYRRACILLADPRMTIEAIAFAVGFAEPSSFSRAFKRWSGMGALDYRRVRCTPLPMLTPHCLSRGR